MKIYTATHLVVLCRFLFEICRWSSESTNSDNIQCMLSLPTFTINHNGSTSKTNYPKHWKWKWYIYKSHWVVGAHGICWIFWGSYLPENAHRFFGPSKARSNNGSARGSATAVEEGDAELKAIEAGEEGGKRKDNAAKHTCIHDPSLDVPERKLGSMVSDKWVSRPQYTPFI